MRLSWKTLELCKVKLGKGNFYGFEKIADDIVDNISEEELGQAFSELTENEFLNQENAHIHFILRSTPSDIYIEGDEKQLSQVFLNLLKNSMQSLEGKTDGQIEVTLEVTDKLYIKLLDNGRGIPMELQEKIFVPFFTTKTEGTGIGLSLCRQIIKRHGGNLYLQESGQERTLFVIEWPIVPFIPK